MFNPTHVIIEGHTVYLVRNPSIHDGAVFNGYLSGEYVTVSQPDPATGLFGPVKNLTVVKI